MEPTGAGQWHTEIFFYGVSNSSVKNGLICRQLIALEDPSKLIRTGSTEEFYDHILSPGVKKDKRCWPWFTQVLQVTWTWVTIETIKHYTSVTSTQFFYSHNNSFWCYGLKTSTSSPVFLFYFEGWVLILFFVKEGAASGRLALMKWPWTNGDESLKNKNKLKSIARRKLNLKVWQRHYEKNC